MPAKLTLLRVATPVASVVALPTLVPLRVKATVAPLAPAPPDVSVADRFVVPPNVPLAAATLSALGSAEAAPVQVTVAVLEIWVRPVASVKLATSVSAPASEPT